MSNQISPRKTLHRFFVVCLSILLAIPHWQAAAVSSGVTDLGAAPVQTACLTNYTSVFFFNGILNSYADAVESTELLRRAYGDTTSSGRRNLYVTMYNTSVGLISDTLEVFDQRLSEVDHEFENRTELFLEVLHGEITWSAAITQVIPGYAQVLADGTHDFVSGIAASLARWTTGDSATRATLLLHKQLLDAALIRGDRLLFLAHSQGNLFANEMYRYANQVVTPASLKEFHLAPASAEIHDAYFLADGDLIIAELERILGGGPRANYSIPPIGLRPDAGFLGNLFGHDFRGIYVNPALPSDPGPSIRAALDANVTTALESTLTDRPTPNTCSTLPPSSVGPLPPLLTVLIAGNLATDNDILCGAATSHPSLVDIDRIGEVVGTGCFSSIHYPANASYVFHQSGSASPSFEMFDFTLSIMNGGLTRLGTTILKDKESSKPVGNFGDQRTTQFASIHIDTVARMTDLLNKVTSRACVLNEATGNPSNAANGSVSITGGQLMFFQGTALVASFPLRNFVSSDMAYDESHYDIGVHGSVLTPGISANAQRNIGGEAYGLFLNVEPDNFSIDMRSLDGSNTSRGLSCVR